MGTQIVIPNIGESVTSGVIAAWSVKDGEYVERDQTVLELETDKVTMEVPAPAAGVVKHSASEGDEVEVGAVVGEIDESAEKSGSSGSSEKSDKAEKSEDGDDKPSGGGTATAEKPEKKKREPVDTEGDGSDSDEGRGSKDEKKDRESDGSGEKDSRESRDRSGSEKKPPSSSGVHKATPLARKLAEDSGIDLGSISGTGAGGRIREQDVLASIQTRRNGAASKPAETEKSSSGGSRSVKREKMSPMRQRIASRLVEAQQTAAMLTTFNEVDMGAVMDLRKQFKEDFEKKHGIGLGFMSFFVKASVQALRKFPLINAYITGGDDGKPAIEKHDYQDVAIAVAGPKGLVVPVIRNAEDMSFAEIESAIKDFGSRARDGKLELSEITGGTFTITNGGVFGSLLSTPILNPPQSAILGMHGIKSRAVEYPEKSGQIALRPMMYLALSYDHRIVDGAEAVQFLVSIKNAIEDPTRLMLDL